MATTTPTALQRFFETKLFCWFLENSTVWAITLIRCQLPDPVSLADQEAEFAKHGRKVTLGDKVRLVLKNIVISYLSSLGSEILSVYALRAIDKLFFQHVPHFTVQRRSDSPFTWNAFKDWSLGNFYLQSIAGGVTLGVCESLLPRWATKELEETEFSFAKFVGNFAIFRVVVDLVFYFGHRALHVNERIYELVHKRHHSHYVTNLRTNWMFSAPDLFIESAMPIGVGFFFLRFLLGIRLGRFDLHLMQQYVAFHESGTHMGKPLALISEHPVLSIAYNWILPQIDARAIEFHETHHNRRDVNYGITPWLEAIVFKTAEFQKDLLKRAAAKVPAVD